MALPIVGIRLVAEGARQFNTETKQAKANVQNLNDAVQKVKPTGAFDSITKSMKNLQAQAAKFNDLPFGIGEMASKFSALNPAVLGVAGSIGIAAAGLGAFIALGTRGAGFEGLIRSFESLTGQSFESSELLRQLELTADGTINKMELLRQTNFALSGSTGEFRDALQDALPRLIEVSRAANQASGIDVGYAFDSIVTGIKRGSPLLIDNLGITLKVGEANEALARQLGITVEEMTSEQKALAILNATLAGADGLIQGVGGVTETAATKIGRLSNTFINLLDRLSIGVQPAFAPFLDLVQVTVDILLYSLEPAIRFIEVAFKAIGFVLTPIVGVIQSVIGAFMEFDSIIRTAIGDSLTVIWVQIREFGQALGIVFDPLFDAIYNIFAPLWNQALTILQTVLTMMVGDLGASAGNFAQGAAAIMGAFIAGIIQGGTEAVRVVADIAEAIGAFLIGESPPPMGALSKIDVGGKNVMNAWMDGFKSASLAPVKQVAENVNKALGSIAKLGLPEVEKRLGQLDQALLPFQEQLKIAESRLNAIKEPAEAAINAINRQFDKLAPALEAGNVAAADQIRQLDALRASFNANVEAQQNAVDLAAIQLAFTQSQQSEERTLLEIQKARLEAAQQGTEQVLTVAKEVEKATGGGIGKQEKGTGKQEKKGTGKTQTPEAATSGMPRMGSGGGSLPEGVIGATDLAAIMNKPIQKAGAVFEKEAGRLKAAGSSISQNINQLPTRIGEAFQELPQTIMSGFSRLISFFTDPSAEGGLLSAVGSFANFVLSQNPLISGAFGLLGMDSITALNPLSLFFSDSRTPNTLLYSLLNFGLRSIPLFNSVKTNFAMFVSDSLDTLAELTGFFYDPEQEGSLPYSLNTLLSNFVDPTTLDIIVAFENVVNTLLNPAGVFATLGTAIGQLISGNVASAINTVIDYINGFVNDVESLINSILVKAREIAAFFNAQSAVPDNVDFPSIPLLGAKDGGVFTGGMLRVGEAGEEIITGADKMAVFPNQFIQAVDRLAAAISNPVIGAPITGNTGNSYNSTNMTNNININQPYNPMTARQQLRMVTG